MRTIVIAEFGLLKTVLFSKYRQYRIQRIKGFSDIAQYLIHILQYIRLQYPHVTGNWTHWHSGVSVSVVTYAQKRPVVSDGLLTVPYDPLLFTHTHTHCLLCHSTVFMWIIK